LSYLWSEVTCTLSNLHESDKLLIHGMVTVGCQLTEINQCYSELTNLLLKMLAQYMRSVMISTLLIWEVLSCNWAST